MNKYYLFIAFAFLLIFSSCSSLRIEKRHYNKGFYVDFGNDKKSSAAVDQVDHQEKVSVETAPQSVQENSDVQASTELNSADVERSIASPTNTVDNERPAAASTTDDAVLKNDATTVEKNTAAQSVPADNDSDVALILLVILAILLPPLAVFLVQGASKWFWVTLILCLFGGGIFFVPYLGGLWLISVIIALFVVFGIL
jgi:uncharacterized membrane protein YqaE (UPF0057 family)